MLYCINNIRNIYNYIIKLYNKTQIHISTVIYFKVKFII